MKTEENTAVKEAITTILKACNVMGKDDEIMETIVDAPYNTTSVCKSNT